LEAIERLKTSHADAVLVRLPCNHWTAEEALEQIQQVDASVPVILCDEWTPAQVKAFRLLVNRSVTWADWDEQLVALELQDIQKADFNLNLTGFDSHEIDALLRLEDDETANAAPPLPQTPVSQTGDLWQLGPHRVLCADATSGEAVSHLLGERKPHLMVTDPPYGIELDSEWRDRAGLNGCGPAEPSYMKKRTAGHTETKISGDTRADWSDAFALVPSLDVAYVWHASKFTSEVIAGLLRIGFVHHQQIIWDKGRTVLTRTHYWFQHEPCWYGVRKGHSSRWRGDRTQSTVWQIANLNSFGGNRDEPVTGHGTQKPVELMRRPILNHTERGDSVYDPFLGSGTTLIAAEQTERVCLGLEIDPRYVDVTVCRWQEFSGKTATLAGTDQAFEQVCNARQMRPK